jgi:adenosylcobalamin-dependent ribonucleoside-triphosphate reductase
MNKVTRAIKWGPLGYITFKRTYSRRTSENDINSKTEEYEETIDRIIKACRSQLRCNFSAEEEAELKDIFLNLKGSVAGRFWWQLGTKTVSRLGLLSLQNCAFTTVDSINSFIWTMDALMLGCGVGFNIQREYVYQLPKIKKVKIVRQETNDADFIVPDKREGWIKLLEMTLKAHFENGEDFTYSTVLVRGKGTPIKGFGGTASGPEELCVGIAEINKILNNRAGKKIRPIDALDVMNVIGSIVVAGNVRRSAEIAIGDADDLQYLASKRWDLGNIPNYRAMSNNSVVCNDIEKLPEQFWEGYDGNGEPFGLINLALSRKVGRLGETQYPDPDVAGYNPCAEQSLAPYETCCLAEIFLPNIESKEDLIKTAKYLYRINKHSLSLPCHLKETEEIVHKNMRMGIGVTGYLQATEEQRSWLSDTYKELRSFDVEYSAKMKWPTSVKITTVKPSGTLSLLAGVTSGVHPAYSQYMIRRIRISSSSPLANLCRKHGYHSEYQKNFDGTEDKNTVVVSFPVKVPEGTILAENTTAVQQLEYVKRLQTEWSDNSVSCTVYYKKEELESIKKWLKENYNDGVKSVSFLLHSEHGFKQAPLEEITKEQYEEYSALVQPIVSGDVNEEDIMDSFECVGGVCPVK